MVREHTAVLEPELEVATQVTTETEVLREAEQIAVAGRERHTEMRPRVDRYIWGTLRIMMGWTFLWPFLDKVFGLGFATERGEGWIDGVSPTFGFLSFATRGPLAETYQEIAGNAVVDWAFMIGLLAIGTALMLGIGVKVAAASGALMLLLMWSAAIWPEHNPFLDDHLIYAFVLMGVAITGAGRYLGLGGWWRRTELVRRHRILE